MREKSFKRSFCAKRGFTLIELLVVVLIIGILAAIALPQYNAAVVRSRLANAKTQGRAIWEAQQVYFLTEGRYATSFAELDIDLPGKASDAENNRSFNGGSCFFNTTYIFCQIKPSIAYVQLGYTKTAPQWLCTTRQITSNSLGRKVCAKETGKDPSTCNHADAGYCAYVYPNQMNPSGYRNPS